MKQFVMETRIQATPERVFEFHEDPDALKLLIPPWERMQVVESSGSLHSGSRVVLQGKLLGVIPVRWVAEHVEYDPPHLFSDVQLSGPFCSWHHRHHMLDGDNGSTILRDEIDYQLPLGWVGSFLGDWLVRKKLQTMFEYRHRTTKRLIESDGRRRSCKVG